MEMFEGVKDGDSTLKAFLDLLTEQSQLSSPRSKTCKREWKLRAAMRCQRADMLCPSGTDRGTKQCTCQGACSNTIGMRTLPEVWLQYSQGEVKAIHQDRSTLTYISLVALFVALFELLPLLVVLVSFFGS